jgi:hypothetical protein
MTSYSSPGPLRTLVAPKVSMVGLPLQGTAVGKKPPIGVGAILTGSNVDVAVGCAGGGFVAVGLLPPPDWVAVAGGGVGVLVGTVWLAPNPQTGFIK